MCGICGITKKDEQMVRKLNATLSHRGPDGADVFVDEGVSLGHSRLAILDLSDNAKQPMQTPDGRFVISYNGEIYNYAELKAEIGDRYTFTSSGDTEVLLAALSIWGVDALPKLKGIFAFAFWDTETQELLLCRDQMGVKPLYYRFDEGVLTFSSELSTFCRGKEWSPSTARLPLYFGLNYTPAPDTLVRGVKKLSPGHYLSYKAGEIKIVEYFDVFVGDGAKNDHDDLIQTIDAAVSRQLVSDRPVGVFLSGGMDSSIVLHHAVQHSKELKSYSVAYEMVAGAVDESEKFNADSQLAERTAAHYGVPHTTFKISINDVRENLETIIQSLDDPVANPTAVAQWFLSKWVREEGVVVALGGDGGDELFGGYTRHRAMMAAYYYDKVPLVLRGLLNHVHPRFAKLNNAPGLPLHVSIMANKDAAIDSIFKNPQNSTEAVRKEFESFYKRAPHDMHVLDQFMRVDRRTWLAEESLTRSDRASMAHGVEMRVPLLDIDVVRMSDQISPFKKTTPWTGKKILRNTYKDHLPSYLYNQPKRGWISPGAKWFRDPEIYKFTKEVFSSGYFSGLDGVIDWEAAHQMLDDHVEKRGYYLQPLWNMLVLQIWCRQEVVKYKMRSV